jgi:hypothetical protein
MALPVYLRRYNFRILGFGLAYAGALIGAVALMVSPAAPKGIAAYLVAIVPALFVIGMIWTMFKLLDECEDEYQRLLFAKGYLLATGITLALATLWGFLEAFKLVPHIELYWVVCLWFPMTGLAGWIVRRGA